MFRYYQRYRSWQTGQSKEDDIQDQREREQMEQQLREVGWSHGFCFWADQQALVFGSDRRLPVEKRPVVSLVKRGARYMVLPATTQRNKQFFHLQPDDILIKGTSGATAQDSYLCDRAERLSRRSLSMLGVLRHGLRIDIFRWLESRCDDR